MKFQTSFTQAFVASLALVTLAAVIAIAAEPNDKKPPSTAEIKLPPGWTQADLEACMLAGTPGKMHEHLLKGTGQWTGKSTMWMGPGAEPITSECTSTVTPIMDGRYIKYEMKGDMPGMGPYNGFGLYGYDNVSQEFNSTWIDNHSTGMMRGTGKLSPDGKTLTWKFTHNCPLTKKPAVMREIETITGPNTRTLEMFGADPKSGQEYKMMSISFVKKEASEK